MALGRASRGFGSVFSSVALIAMVGCAQDSDDSAASASAVVPESTLAALLPGETPHIVVDGLEAGGLVDLVACRGHYSAESKVHYVSRARFRADAKGALDLSATAPEAGGSYEGADAFGVFWSMKEEACPLASPPAAYDLVRIEVTKADGSRRTLEQPMPDVRADVTTEELTLEADGVIGRLYKPAGAGPWPGVVVWGGSDGMLPEAQAKLFASHGYATLAIQYFDYVADPAQFPNLILDVPLEYFGRAIDWLREKPFVAGDKVAIVGASRGGEAALLVGSRFGDKLTAVVAARPSDVVWGDRANGTWSRAVGVEDEVASWTWQGQPVPFMPMGKLLQELSDEGKIDDVPSFKYRKAYETVEDAADPAVKGAALIDTRAIPVPVFACGGTDDQLWPASRYVERIKAARAGLAVAGKDRFVIAEGAGHYTSTPDRPTHPDQQFLFPSGVYDRLEGDEYVMAPEYAINGGTPVLNHRQDLEVTAGILAFLNENR